MYRGTLALFFFRYYLTRAELALAIVSANENLFMLNAAFVRGITSLGVCPGLWKTFNGQQVIYLLVRCGNYDSRH